MANAKIKYMEKNLQQAVFGGGCFWCTEAIFQNLKGVQNVEPGYAGGHKPHPTYQQVSSGTTGYAEVIKIDFDPQVITYSDLLEVFFATHNPTTLNRQGNDVGTQYRSVIFYANDEQKIQAQNYVKNHTADFSDKIVTTLEKLTDFYPAEDYHKNYYERNKDNPYCQIVISPKLKKFKEKHPELLKR